MPKALYHGNCQRFSKAIEPDGNPTDIPSGSHARVNRPACPERRIATHGLTLPLNLVEGGS